MKLSLRSLAITNLRSIRNQVITFPTQPGLRFLFGINEEEPNLGANGAGKSTVWEALHWCLFGVGQLGARTSALTTWGESETVVTVTIQADNDTYDIRRSGPPSKLTINGKWAEQQDLENLLGITKSRFQNSVIFAQGQMLFPDLSIPERGALLEEVLNLQFWTKASDTASEQLALANEEVKRQEIALARVEGQLAGLGTESKILAQKTGWDAEKRKHLDTLQVSLDQWNTGHDERTEAAKLLYAQFETKRTANIERLTAESLNWKHGRSAAADEKLKLLEEYDKELAHLPESSNGLPDLERAARSSDERLSSIQQSLAVIHNDLTRLRRDYTFWDLTDECEACKQPINEDHRKKHQSLLKTSIDKVLAEKTDSEKRAQDALTERGNAKEKYNAAFAQHAAQQTNERRLRDNVMFLEKEVETLIREMEQGSPYDVQIEKDSNQPNPYTQQLKDVGLEVNPYTELIKRELARVNPHIQELADFRVSFEKLRVAIAQQKSETEKARQNATCIEYWRHGFKRLRLYLITRVLTALQVEINSSVAALGLSGWKVELRTETETRTGTLKAGMQIVVKSPRAEANWESWSGGERQRLRLGITLGLASLIQRSSEIYWDMEVLDEQTTFLSTQGVEGLMELLDFRAASAQKRIWVCDHTALSYAGFREIWTAKKTAAGTEIAPQA